MKKRIQAMLEAGYSREDVAEKLVCDIAFVSEVDADRRVEHQLGDRMKTAWEPAMRTHTKMLEPEARK